MQVLVVLTQPPLPEGGAPGRCAVGLLRGLRENGIDARGLAARQHHAFPGQPPLDLPVEIVTVPSRPRGWQTRLKMITAPRGHLAEGSFADRVRQLSRSADVLHLEETDAARCDRGLSVPSLVHVHYLVRLDRPFGPPWRKQFFSVVEFARAERAAARQHRWLVASSPVIADHLRSIAPKAEVVVAPLSLDPSRYSPSHLDGPIAGIIGTGGWAPTADAVRRLVERVWPLVRARVPGARLLVAGRGTASLGLARIPGVEIVGEVESGADFVRSLSVLLYPIERGSGMKVKVLEALACGVPVVTTPQGAEGVVAHPGIVVETDDAGLASAAAGILLDDRERHERGAAALEAFHRNYAPAPATLPLVELYARMAEQG